jgi:hypothetical protein
MRSTFSDPDETAAYTRPKWMMVCDHHMHSINAEALQSAISPSRAGEIGGGDV